MESVFALKPVTLSSAGPPGPWLSLVGLGEDGRFRALRRSARRAGEQPEIVFGGERHLKLIGNVPGEARPWPQPFRNALPAILAEKRPGNVCVLATSDPFHYGIGAGLTKAVAGRRGNARHPAALLLLDGLHADALAAGGMRAGLAAWPRSAADHPAAPAGRTDPGTVLGRFDTGSRSRRF
jgi:hypothetical protein